MKNIYVGNLSFDATEDQVRSMFEAYGPVDRVSIVTDRRNVGR
jgi:cold-inducible RNA-binding protein